MKRGAIVLAWLASVACSGGSNSASSRSAPDAGATEKPWSRASYDDPDGWWMKWKVESPPFDAGTRFEIEHVAADGTKTMETLVVTSITKQARGSTYTVQMERGDGMSVRGEVPPSLRYSPGPRGYITTRNAKLVPVSVPAGDFMAARMWSAETLDGRSHEVDEWVVPDLPVRVQVWSRPKDATELYDPPADAVIPLGNAYSRLVKVERRVVP